MKGSCLFAAQRELNGPQSSQGLRLSLRLLHFCWLCLGPTCSSNSLPVWVTFICLFVCFIYSLFLCCLRRQYYIEVPGCELWRAQVCQSASFRTWYRGSSYACRLRVGAKSCFWSSLGLCLSLRLAARVVCFCVSWSSLLSQGGRQVCHKREWTVGG